MPSILHIIQTLSGGGAAREMLNISRYSTGSSEYSHQIATLMQSSEHGLALAADAGVSVLDAPAPEQLREAIGDADIVQLEWWNCPELTAFLTSRIPASRFVIRYHVAGHRAPQNIIPEYLRLADFNIIAFDGAPALQSCDKSDRRLRKILHNAAQLDRLQGYRNALIRAGHPVNEELIPVPPLNSNSSGIEFGFQATATLLDEHPEVTAIFAASTDLAEGAGSACHRKGLRIPEDISLLGCDDSQHAEYFCPPLTVIDIPNDRLGHTAAAWIHQRLQNESPDRPPVEPWMQGSLIVRETTAPPPA